MADLPDVDQRHLPAPIPGAGERWVANGRVGATAISVFIALIGLYYTNGRERTVWDELEAKLRAFVKALKRRFAGTSEPAHTQEPEPEPAPSDGGFDPRWRATIHRLRPSTLRAGAPEPHPEHEGPPLEESAAS